MRSVLMTALLLLLVTAIQSCSGIKFINQQNFYSEEFLKKIGSVQLIYRDGDKKLALTKLEEINDDVISQDERAKKYNLKGIMLFSLQNLEGAIENFSLANQLVGKDQSLASNIKLNLASSYFKLESYDEVNTWLKDIETDYLKDKELKNYYRLSFSIGVKMDNHRLIVDSLIYLTRGLESFKQFEDYKYKEILIDHFKQLSSSERVNVLDKNEKNSISAIAYLGKLEAMSRFYKGDRAGSQDVVDWLEKEFRNLEDVKSFVADYKFRVDNFSKINSGAIGIIAPLSGKLASYGQKIISGVNTALLNQKNNQTINLYIKDNQNNSFLAKNQIRELAMKYHVSAIIGGLFPHLAKAEYLEARKYGILYISLSPVYIPRSEKDHLLIEISGSVESQISGILKPENLEFFGKRVGIFYPWSDEGKSYVNELWSLNNTEKIKLTSINNFKKGISDYRDPIKALLGLKYSRSRAEEFKIWKEIKNINKRNVRIVNVLPPVIDFDWIFIPSIPKEAIQILPTFEFFDAKRLKFVGGPSWVNKRLQKQRKRISSRMFVISNETEEISSEFKKLYKEHNGVAPHLIDTLSFEGMSVVISILEDQNFSKRDELTKRVLSFNKLSGLTSHWDFKNGLWIKDMDILEIRSSGIRKLKL